MSETKYIVTTDCLGVRGEERLLRKGKSTILDAPVKYWRRGDRVTADEAGGLERAEKLVERGHLKAEADVAADEKAKAKIAEAAAEAQAEKEKARMDRLRAEQGDEPVGENPAALAPSNEQLDNPDDDTPAALGDQGGTPAGDTGETRKQALVREAGELGLDTEGTIAVLEERIAAKKAESGS